MNIYFGLGSNLGSRLQNLRDAVRRLATFGHVSAKSDVFSTEPWGGVPQPDYLNACVKISCEHDIAPSEILARVKQYEREIGRVESVRWGARKIDIDILLVDGVILDSPDLVIPHARIPERLFVLVPLSEIIPENWQHPVNGKSIREMMSELDGEAWPLRITAL
ncbi:MAG: 2-amino-4-hydroxy-6-hydroxymethyldihydropteridine diphosphokinase [Synergistaceae bacterium]|nr:2-amino-4-hydroxy-6-hydroxymethyldihydropteridine diphosphokinase [Synergistaceae bacterium]MBQ7169555.1 2-amino-4-hydroxy-6-hydroxymethyldihydropteridine diphosphokinase [Synergistaceae bacterium]MBR0256335.1 2-amino-4-hydroxy-6-hydroxymethyldihydropteridine diphosphokinase [Synergistaceae bacterium]